MESVSAVISELWSSMGKKKVTLVGSTIDKEAMSSAEVMSLSITTLQPTLFLIPAAVAYSF